MHKRSICLFFTFLVISHGLSLLAAEPQWLNDGKLSWVSYAPIFAPVERPDDPCYSVKDPSIVFFEGRYHIFATIRSEKRTHQIEYISFTDWKNTDEAKRCVLTMHSGFFCAPQIFYFTPHKKWYLICQASDPGWKEKYGSEYGAAFSTTETIADPDSWSSLTPLGAEKVGDNAGLDFWIICDSKKAYLFFTTLDGKMWREETPLNEFPHGWSKPKLAIEGDIFEASHTYKIKGKDSYLTIVEAQNGPGWRYYKAYTAEKLDGNWKPLADSKEKNFASMNNVRFKDQRWSDSISHVELIRAGIDETMEIDPSHLRLIYQGVTDSDLEGKVYGQIPWKLGVLESETK